MTRDSFTVRSIGVAASCALAALAVMRCRTASPPVAQRATAPAIDVARRNARGRGSLITGTAPSSRIRCTASGHGQVSVTLLGNLP